MTQTEQTVYQRRVKNSEALHSAIKSVMVFNITDAFNLQEYECIWAHTHVSRILEPLLGAHIKSIAAPVKDELLTGMYSRKIAERRWDAHQPQGVSDTQQASVYDWAKVLANIILECYSVRPLYETSLVAQFVGLLTELGVGDPENPRASIYLPTALRYQMVKSI